MDVRIERTGTFTLYGDPAIVNLDGPEPGMAAGLDRVEPIGLATQ